MGYFSLYSYNGKETRPVSCLYLVISYQNIFNSFVFIIEGKLTIIIDISMKETIIYLVLTKLCETIHTDKLRNGY